MHILDRRILDYDMDEIMSQIMSEKLTQMEIVVLSKTVYFCISVIVFHVSIWYSTKHVICKARHSNHYVTHHHTSRHCCRIWSCLVSSLLFLDHCVVVLFDNAKSTFHPTSPDPSNFPDTMCFPFTHLRRSVMFNKPLTTSCSAAKAFIARFIL